MGVLRGKYYIWRGWSQCRCSLPLVYSVAVTWTWVKQRIVGITSGKFCHSEAQGFNSSGSTPGWRCKQQNLVCIKGFSLHQEGDIRHVLVVQEVGICEKEEKRSILTWPDHHLSNIQLKQNDSRWEAEMMPLIAGSKVNKISRSNIGHVSNLPVELTVSFSSHVPFHLKRWTHGGRYAVL